MRHTAGANSCAAAPVLILLGFRNGRDRFDVAAVESCGIKDASNSSGTLGTAVRGGGPMWNNMKTTLLLAGLTGLLLAIGQLWAGEGGLVFALVLAGVMNLGSYFFSDKIALAMSGAQPVSRGEAARLYAIVERLAAKANIPVPKIYQIPTDSPNAFATGRNPNHASVAVTRGILDVCDDEEIEGVLARKIGQVVEAAPHGGLAHDGAHFHLPAVDHRRDLYEPLFHSPAHPQANRAAHRPRLRVIVRGPFSDAR